ncbi:hypothetical protein [Bartonella raoultii]|uniref:hypothetical protein n=1 Tax=Bartonella raoultii TaxID=1457020 RepID=UPI001ABA1491|nr:hypothetical protein [Bartonella raoultii]
MKNKKPFNSSLSNLKVLEMLIKLNPFKHNKKPRRFMNARSINTSFGNNHKEQKNMKSGKLTLKREELKVKLELEELQRIQEENIRKMVGPKEQTEKQQEND